MNERDQVAAKVKEAQEIISRSEKADVGLFVRGRQLYALRPDLLTDDLLHEINGNLAEVIGEILTVKVNEVIAGHGVSVEDLSYYFGTDWAESHEDDEILMALARSVCVLKGDDEFFDTVH